MADAPILKPGSVAIGGTPAGVRQSAQTVVGTSGMHIWAQQCLTFELIENIGLLGAGVGRCLKISSKGTIINAAQYRGQSMSLAADPMVRGVADHLAWAAAEKDKKPVIDNQFVLDDFSLSIEVQSAKGKDNAEYPGTDWYVSDISPTSKINDTMLSTGTSSGLSVGLMGDIPTINYEQGTNSNREWTLPDYALLALAGRNSNSMPHGTWQIRRSTLDSDPLIANASLSPDLEVVFTLNPQAKPKRYLVLTTLMSVVFKKQSEKKMKQIVDEKIGLGKALIGPIGSALLGGLEAVADEAFPLGNAPQHVHTFLMKFIVDWEEGTVASCMLPSIGSLSPTHSEMHIVSTISAERGILEEYAKSRKNLERKFDNSLIGIEDAKSLIEAPIDNVDTSIIDMKFDRRSPIGIAENPNSEHPDDSSAETFDISIGSNIRDWSTGMRFYTKINEPQEVPVLSWLPFKNAARVRVPNGKGPQIWAAPVGYSGGQVAYFGEPGLNGTEFPPNKALDALSAVGLPDVPDAYSNTGEHVMLLWRDYIYSIYGGSIKSSYKPCVRGLGMAAFTQYLSIGIADGEVIASMDGFVDAIPRVLRETISLTEIDGETKRESTLYKEFRRIIDNNYRVSLFSLYNTIFLVGGQDAIIIDASSYQSNVDRRIVLFDYAGRDSSLPIDLLPAGTEKFSNLALCYHALLSDRIRSGSQITGLFVGEEGKYLIGGHAGSYVAVLERPIVSGSY